MFSDDVACGVEQDAFDAYNMVAAECGLPVARALTAGRLAKLRRRLAEGGGLRGWMMALEAIKKSAFLKGENNRRWRADLDFVLQSKSFARLMEGSYAGEKPKFNNGFAQLLYEASQGVNGLGESDSG